MEVDVGSNNGNMRYESPFTQKLVGEGLRLQFVRDIDLDVCNWNRTKPLFMAIGVKIQLNTIKTHKTVNSSTIRMVLKKT